MPSVVVNRASPVFSSGTMFDVDLKRGKISPGVWFACRVAYLSKKADLDAEAARFLSPSRNSPAENLRQQTDEYLHLLQEKSALLDGGGGA